jgi:hypothetical protein
VGFNPITSQPLLSSPSCKSLPSSRGAKFRNINIKFKNKLQYFKFSCKTGKLFFEVCFKRKGAQHLFSIGWSPADKYLTYSSQKNTADTVHKQEFRNSIERKIGFQERLTQVKSSQKKKDSD